MARTAHRTVIISAAFALASWALVAGAPALAAAPTNQAGPQLPTPEYKPLPVGTVVTYDTWSYTVTKSDGYDITYKTNSGDWRHDYAVFGRHGDGAYGMSSEWKASLNDENKAALESFWPPKVGNKIVLNLGDDIQDTPYAGSLFGPSTRNWTVTLEVLGTAFLDLNGFRYPTYVIREHAISELVSSYAAEIPPLEYSETKWYNPESGLILKSVKDWTRGPMKGDRKEYSLVRVRFPQGTKTHVLAGTKVPGEADARLLAEIARLKRALQDPGFGAPERPAQVAAVQPARKIEPANIPDIEFGRYHALVIGIGNYKHLPRLKTAVNDAKAVADVLRQDYGFTVKLLLDPARDDIVDTLDEYRAALGQADNLLIYYAGHGWVDEDSNRGYWLAADARPNRRSKWVSNATITDTLKTLQAKHVMVVADSCYSGTLIRGAPVGLRSGNYWRRMAKKRARVALTSGGLEPVADIGGGGHSPFATAFIGALKGNAAVMDGTTLFNEVRRPVMLSADQTPEYSDVRRAGHDGGDFLFVRRR